MKRTTTRDKIRGVCKRWYNNYHNDDGWKSNYQGKGVLDKRIVYDKLCRLNLETATAEDVEAIIGNSTWTDIQCDECRKFTSVGIIMGDNDWTALVFCEEYLKHALEMTRD